MLMLFARQSHNAALSLQKQVKPMINQTTFKRQRPSLRSANYVANQSNIVKLVQPEADHSSQKAQLFQSIHNILITQEGAVLNFYTRPSHKHWIPTFPAFRRPSISPGGFRPRARARSHRASLVIPRHGPYAMFMSNSRNTFSFSS